ncbi:MAG: ATP-binding protein [Defluviitaleaceae bacterium]|nr:ATP-binding protein [Defluviitaleaceae bacterium]
MAIIKPQYMDFTGKKFSMLISGSPGTGKTTLALSAPNPLLIDFDKGISRVKAQHRVPTIQATNYEEVLKDLESPEMAEFKTIVIDTGGSLVTFLQDWAMRINPTTNRKKDGGISLQGFGAVKSEFIRFTSQLQYTSNKHVIYVFHTVEEKDRDIVKQRLLCEGAARNIVWQPCDIGCFLQVIGTNRIAGFTPTEEYFAKGSYGVAGERKITTLTESTPNDYITRLFEQMQLSLKAESAIFGEREKEYNEAIETGKELVESINDIESANAFADNLKKIDHALTSEKEIGRMAKKRIKELGYSWNRSLRVWEVNGGEVSDNAVATV